MTALAGACAGLTHLRVDGTRVRDAGVAAVVRGCRGLQELDLQSTQITDATVHLLAKAIDAAHPPELDGRLPRMAFLNLTHTAISPSGVAQLQCRGCFALLCRCGKGVRVEAVRLGEPF